MTATIHSKGFWSVPIRSAVHVRRRGMGPGWLWLPVIIVGLMVGGGPLAAQGTATVHGHVRTDSTRLPVAGATVELRYPGWTGGAVTDESGAYLLRQVPAGRGVLRVRHLAHEPLEVEVIVSAGREVVLDALLAVRPVLLEGVTAEAEPPPVASESGPGGSPALARVGARVIETTPGLAEMGITEAVRGIPGAEPPDPASVLYVRGAAADLKLVYLDGAPVYAPFPLGGLLDPFAPGILQHADIYLGGAPARYDGGLSYVMDLRTRAGQEKGIRTSGSADLLSARLMAEAGRDGLSLIASARGVHPFGAAAFLQDDLPYQYGEGLIRADARIGSVGVLSVTGFSNREAVDVGEAFPGGGQIRWANRSGSTRFRGIFGATAAEFTLAVGDYSARLPLVSEQSLVAEGAARRTRLSLDLARRFDALQLRYGLSVDEQEHEAWATPVESAIPSVSIEAAGRVAGVYGEVAAQPLSRLRLRGGARIDHFSTVGETVVAPRMAATWMVTDRAALTMAAGRYHQFLRPPDEVLLRSEGSASLPLAAAMVVGSSSHFTLSLDQDLGEGTRLGIEGFYKHFADVPATRTTQANASGMDLWVRRSTDAGINGWLGYSLAWVWSNSTMPGEADFAGRHLLSTGIAAPLGGRTNLEIRFAYGAGLPYAAIPVRDALHGSRAGTNYVSAQTVTSADRGGTETAPLLHTPDQPFLRLDAAISQRWESRRGSRIFEFSPYIRVLNSLGRRDALFYFLDSKEMEDFRAIGALPLVPVLGLEWKF